MSNEVQIDLKRAYVFNWFVTNRIGWKVPSRMGEWIAECLIVSVFVSFTIVGMSKQHSVDMKLFFPIFAFIACR